MASAVSPDWKGRKRFSVFDNITHRGLEEDFALTFSFTYIQGTGIDDSVKKKGLGKHLHFNFLLISSGPLCVYQGM